MSQNKQHFKIGLFVSLAIVLAVAVVVYLGGGALLQEKIIMETYMDQTVQGLEVGSPVKYRGVKIGEVERITFVGEEYSSDHMDFLKYNCERMVLIQMALVKRGPLARNKEEIQKALAESIRQGLRVRLAAQGLTGVMFLEADYMDPVRFPVLPICWEAMHPYIPSATSMVKRFTDSLDKIMFKMERVDFRTPLKKLETTLDVVTNAVGDARIAVLSEEIRAFLEDFRGMQGHVVELVEDMRPLIEETTQAAAAGRKILEKAEGPFGETVEKRIPDTITNVNDLIDKLETLAVELPKNVEELPAVIAQLRVTLRRLDNVVKGEQENITAIIDNLRIVTENLKEFSENAKEYPSQVIFGEPPSRKE